jgi:hypothetical protein
MIKILVNGGLGNQMFQYAFGRAASLRHKTELILDISWYGYRGKNTKRNFKLNCFNIKGNVSTSILRGLLNKILGKMRIIKKITEEKIFDFNEEIIKIKSGCFEGFWQNENYFKDFLNYIKQDFSLKEAPSNKVLVYQDKIISSESTSVHIRRGDYVNNRETEYFHGVLPNNYYEEATNIIYHKYLKPCFFIFSDDIEWVKNNFTIPGEVNYVSDNGFDEVEEMYLMSLCKHNIIANSSFSWWGAYLNSNPHKIVVAPKKWINSDKYDTGKLLPVSWIKI